MAGEIIGGLGVQFQGTNPGSALLSKNIDPTKALSDTMDRIRSRELQNIALKRQEIQDARAADIFDRQTKEYDREIAGRDALREYASKPIDTATMLDSQRGLADEAFIADTNARIAKWEASLKANNITQDQVDKGLVSNDVMAKLYNPALDAKTSEAASKLYSTMTPFREDVESKIEKDLITKNIDPLKAKQYAQMEGSKYQSIPEYQTFLNTQAEKLTANEKEKRNALMDNAKFALDVDKANVNAWKDEQDLVLKKLGMMYGSGGTGGSGTGSMGGGLLNKSPDPKMQEKINTKTGNEKETMDSYVTGVSTYGPRVAAAALEMQIDKPVKWYDPFEAGNRDIDIKKFESDMKELSKTMPSYNNVLDTSNSNRPKSNDYTIPGAAQVYTPDSARAMAQNTAAAKMKELLGTNPVSVSDLPISSNKQSSVSSGPSNSILTEMPTSLKKMEGTKTTAYDDGKGNITIGTGYNISSKSNEELVRDFKAAGINPSDIPDIKSGKKQITDSQVKGLESVSYATDGPNKLKRLGIDVENLNPMLAEIGVSQSFRGDIVKNGDGYRGRLYEHLKNNDLEGMVKDITTSSDIPKEVKQRLKLVPGIGTAGAEGPKTEAQMAYDNPKLKQTNIGYLANKLDSLLSTDQSIKGTDNLFGMSNTVSSIFGPGTEAYSSKDRADFAQKNREKTKEINSFVNDNIGTVNSTISKLNDSLNSVTRSREDIQEKFDSYNQQIRSPEFVNMPQDKKQKFLSEYGQLNKQYSATSDKIRELTSSLNSSMSLKDKMLAQTGDNEPKNVTLAKEKLAESDAYANDPTLLQGLEQVGLTTVKSVPMGGAYANKASGGLVGKSPTEIKETFSSLFSPKTVTKVPGTQISPYVDGAVTSAATKTESVAKMKNDTTKIHELMAKIDKSGGKVSEDVKQELLDIAKTNPKYKASIVSYLQKQGF